MAIDRAMTDAKLTPPIILKASPIAKIPAEIDTNILAPSFILVLVLVLFAPDPNISDRPLPSLGDLSCLDKRIFC